MSTSGLETVAVVVTYAERHSLCLQVIDAAFREGVTSVVLVDNHSSDTSHKKYLNICELNPRVIYIRQSANRGSSGGFKAGIEYAVENLEFKFLWLLDDDNVPRQGALYALTSNWKTLNPFSSKGDVVLYSYRGQTRPNDSTAVRQGFIKGQIPNAFIGFDLFQFLLRNLRSRSQDDEIKFPVVRVRLGPYGGIFISRAVVELIGFPDENFFVYADDHEYTGRIAQAGFDQYLVYASMLDDIDESFGDDGLFSKKVSNLKVYFTIRNHVYLSRRHATLLSVYWVNKCFFMLHLFKKSSGVMVSDFRFWVARFRLILRAIKEGEHGRLGSTFDQ